MTPQRTKPYWRLNAAGDQWERCEPVPSFWSTTSAANVDATTSAATRILFSTAWLVTPGPALPSRRVRRWWRMFWS